MHACLILGPQTSEQQRARVRGCQIESGVLGGAHLHWPAPIQPTTPAGGFSCLFDPLPLLLLASYLLWQLRPVRRQQAAAGAGPVASQQPWQPHQQWVAAAAAAAAAPSAHRPPEQGPAGGQALLCVMWQLCSADPVPFHGVLPCTLRRLFVCNTCLACKQQRRVQQGKGSERLQAGWGSRCETK